MLYIILHLFKMHFRQFQLDLMLLHTHRLTVGAVTVTGSDGAASVGTKIRAARTTMVNRNCIVELA